MTAFDNARLADGRLVGFRVEDGRFAAIRDAGGGGEDLGGELVVPGFVEGHIHLDTSFWGDAWIPHKPCTAGFDVRERVAFQAQNFDTAAAMDVRARSQLELCLGQGSTTVRSHVFVSADVGLSHVETILAIREEYRGLVDIQLVAFPQSGILSSPGTGELMDEAMAMGCDVVGGLDPASFDRDVSGQLDVIFALAETHGAGIDIHLHDHGTLGAFEIEEVVARTASAGMAGKVAVSHAYALGDIGPDALARLADRIAAAGVSIMTTAPGAHPFPPVKPLTEAGVTVFAGNDNIRDSWSPYGDGDMLGRAMMIGYRSGYREDADLRLAFDTVTSAGARALGLPAYGIAEGAPADFVTLAAAHVPEAVVGVPANRRVYKAGRLVASNGRVLREPAAA